MRKLVIGSAAVVVLAAAWAVFRPELLFIDKEVSESLPGASAADRAPSEETSAVLLSGEFHGVAHKTTGAAAIHRLADGRRVLRFTGFETSNGPDLQVYLGMAEDARDNETVTRAGFASLGALKGNVGDQNYEVPDELDLSRFRSVTIWCRRFGVNFATAPLAARVN